MLTILDCPKIKQLVSLKEKATTVCPYHKTVHLDKTGQYRANSSCENIENIVTKNWFVLPPVIEWYYKNQHIEHQYLPPFCADCASTQTPSMDFIYPKITGNIYLTKVFKREIQPVILKVAHPSRGV